ncbi:hypothetical protein BGX28_009237 [Mortierella sp. GBA30]|nr:hypothetical protein BGX28_009237 [Mortierella sp. GBA30]
MGCGPDVVLKVTLWLQAYATLVGVWSVLAIIHTIIICGLISVPPEFMNPVLILGQKIVDNNSDPMKTVIPCIYAVQALSWCASLICLVCMRLAEEDPTIGFEIQQRRSTRKKSLAHSLGAAQQNADGHTKKGRISQRLFGMRPSLVAPFKGSDDSLEKAEAGEAWADKEKDSTEHQDRQEQEQQHTAYDLDEPHVSWVADDRRTSNDSSTIYFPLGRRISQVVVTFKDDIEGDDAEDFQYSPVDATTALHMKQKSLAVGDTDLEARRVMITHDHYGFEELPLSPPGESLSDMIFKAVQQPLFAELSSKEMVKTILTKDLVGRASNDSDLTDAETKAESPTLSITTTLDGSASVNEREQEQEHEHDHAVERLAMTTAAGSSVILSKDQVEQLEQLQQQRKRNSISWHLLMEQDKQQEDQEDEEAETSPTAKKLSFASFPIVPARRSSFGYGLPERLGIIGEDDESDSDDDDDDNSCRQQSRGQFEDAPTMQPNSSASHPFSNDAYSSPSDATSPMVTEAAPSPRPKPSLASIPLQYWRSRNSGNNPHANGDSPTSPSLPFNIAHTFSKKKKRPTATTPPPQSPPANPFIIPTIVLHPDEEDGQPARVLSELDIEYLSTMPPPPLRLLVQPWDEVEDDEYYDEYHREYEDECDDEDGEELISQVELGHDEKVRENGDLEYYDPYALDVPINLEIDLQSLDNAEMKTRYGYI